jgi:hypothetical protein
MLITGRFTILASCSSRHTHQSENSNGQESNHRCNWTDPAATQEARRAHACWAQLSCSSPAAR